jgi:hypothetical protein
MGGRKGKEEEEGREGIKEIGRKEGRVASQGKVAVIAAPSRSDYRHPCPHPRQEEFKNPMHEDDDDDGSSVSVFNTNDSDLSLEIGAPPVSWLEDLGNPQVVPACLPVCLL